MTDPQEPGSAADGPGRGHDVERSMAAYAARSGMRRKDNGQLDVLHAVGGWRGLAETILPGFEVISWTGMAAPANLP